MILQYLKIALTRFRKNGTLSVLNIVGLSFGLASTILILFWIKNELNYDTCFTNADRIAQAYLKGTNSDGESYQTTTSPEIAGMLKNNYPEVENATRVSRLDEVSIKFNDKLFLEDMGGAADPNFFEIFDYDFISGDPSNVLTDPYSVVLTSAFAEKYFGEENPLGKILTVNSKYDFTVTGIIDKLPDNAYRRFDFMVPFTFLGELGYQLTGEPFFPCSYINYALLREGSDIKALSEKTENDIWFENEFIKFEIALKPLKEIYLTESGGKTKVRIFTVVAILTLLLACINSINFISGLYINNIRNVSVQRVIGARKIHLFNQLLTENVVNASIAVIVGLALIQLVLPPFNELTNSNLYLNFSDPYFWMILLGIVIVTSILTGLFPALMVSGINIANILGNKFSGGQSKRVFQKSLLVFQFIITIFFVVSILVLHKQSNLVDEFHFGYNSSNIVYLDINGEIQEKAPIVKQELLRNPNIKSVTTSSDLPCNLYNGSYFNWGIEEINARRISWIYTDPDFFETLEIQAKEGRLFSNEYGSDGQSVVVNQKLLDLINEKSPIGKQLTFDGNKYSIIGVVDNIQHGSPLNLQMAPMAYFMQPDNCNYLLIKTTDTQGDPVKSQQIMSQIKSVCDSYSPERPLQYAYLDQFTPNTERIFNARQKLILFSTIVMILISCFGLLGLVILSANQKTKQTGIRKVNGARVQDILIYFNQDIIKWVGLAFVIACPLAWFAMSELLKQFVHKTTLDWWIFAIAGITTLIFSILTVSWQSWKTASGNPVKALRYE